MRRTAIVAALVCLVDVALAGSCSAAKLCCQGRDSGCVIQKESPNAIIESPRDKPCYCDHACLKLADCCDDFKQTCGVVDCSVSEWSSWSACDNACGSGTQRRSRAIQNPEKNGGKHCPRLDQVRSCRSFEACRTGMHFQQRDRSVTILSLFPANENDTGRAGVPEKHDDKSASCVAFTIVRASRACGRISASLAEGSRICLERHGPEPYEERLVGIGKWKLSAGGELGTSAMNAANTSCHGKWIGDSRLRIDCEDVRCRRSPIVSSITATSSRRARRSIVAEELGGESASSSRRRTSRRRRRGRRRKRSRRRRRSDTNGGRS